MFTAFMDHDAERESKHSEWHKQEAKLQEAECWMDPKKKDEIQPIQKPNCKSRRQGESDSVEPFVEKT